ncbi:MAG: AgmX/PglI C-terminal domain-containing protein [Candidatus Binatia bacterium]
MDNRAENRGRSRKRWVTRALIGCAFGAGLIFLALQSKSDKTDEAGNESLAKKKIQRTWNMALGNVVVVAPELGLTAKSLKGVEIENSRIAMRLESQLQPLREFYRQESESDPTLMGGMLFQLTVNSAGEVTQVKELASRITDGEFKKTVLAEVSKWTFPEILSDDTIINCPILFVREGMDITTLVQWEKSLGQFNENSAMTKLNTQTTQEKELAESKKRSAAASAKTADATKAKHEQNSERKSISQMYQIKHPTAIRQEPSFASASVGKFTPGTKVTVIAARGDWVQVRTDNSGVTGFIRREFVTPAN